LASAETSIRTDFISSIVVLHWYGFVAQVTNYRVTGPSNLVVST